MGVRIVIGISIGSIRIVIIIGISIGSHNNRYKYRYKCRYNNGCKNSIRYKYKNITICITIVNIV